MERVLKQAFGGGLLGKLGSQAILKTYLQQPSCGFYTLKDKQTNKEKTLIDGTSNK